MKFSFRVFAVVSTFLIISGQNLSAQTAAPVWAVDFVKTKQNEQQNYLKFIENNWAKARAFMKQKGIVASYQVLTVPQSEAADWDVLLMTEYINANGYEQRETVFQEYKKSVSGNQTNSAATPIGNVREFSEIKFSRKFNRPISSELGIMMLRTQTTEVEKSAVRIPLENYLKAHATGSPEIMKNAFNPGAKIEGWSAQGKYVSWTLDEYLKGMSGKPADDEPKRKRWIESVEITGSAAIAKLMFDYPTVKITDYMLLLKINGEWKIVNKIFQGEQKPQPQK